MPSSRRSSALSADALFVPAAELRSPRTASDLLAALGVESAARSEQRRAVTLWLEDNKPSALMRAGLVRLGLQGAPKSVER